MTSALLRRLPAAVAGLVAIGGLAVVSSPALAASSTLISTEATTWSYIDEGSDPAAGLPDRTDWTDPEFDDSAWKTAKGSFGAKNGALASVSGFMPHTLLTQYGTGTTDIPAFFFRTEVDLPTGALDGVGSLSASLVYDDAATVYVNGSRVAGFDDASITSNLAYGGSNADVPKLATFTVPASAFVTGSNTVAVELHQGRATSSDIYFDFTSLQPGDEPPAASAISDLILNIGATESQRNVNWMSTSTDPQVVQLVPAVELVEDEFPADGIQTITSTQGAASDAGKTYHKATITGLQPNTEYAYRVGQEGSWSAVQRFLTGDFDNNYDFIYVGDPQVGSSGNATADANGFADTLDKAEIEVPAAEFIFSAGDQVETGGNEAHYDGFLSPHQVRELATATTMRNHDNGNRGLYAQHYNLPNQ